MRSFVLSLLALSACYDGSDYGTEIGNPTWNAEARSLELASSSLTERSSLVLTPSGEVATRNPGRRNGLATGALVGMSNMVCELNWRSASVQMDYDPSSADTEVVTDWDQDTVLTVTPEGFQVLDPDSGDSDRIRRPGVVDARIGRGAHIIVIQEAEGCAIEFGPRHRIEVPGECATGTGFAVDADSMTAWSADSDGITEIDRDGVRPFGAAGDLLARDAERNILYVANTGGSEVRAYGADRSLLWTASIDGAVRQLRAAPARGLVAVLADRDAGSAILYMDAATGEVREAGQTGSQVQQLTLSPDGSRLALVSNGAIHLVDDRSVTAEAE